MRLFVTINENLLDKIIETYHDSNPEAEPIRFAVYLILLELKRFRKLNIPDHVIYSE